VDQQLKQIQWNDSTTTSTAERKVNSASNAHIRSGIHLPYCLPTVTCDTYRLVANKKRMDESNKPDGLVILQATLVCQTSTEIFDITDTLQFWVVNSQLNMSFSDVRLLWQIGDRIHKKDTVLKKTSVWWRDTLFYKSKPSQLKNVAVDISFVEVRYQYKGTTYQIVFDASTATGDTASETDVDDNDIGSKNTKFTAIQLPNRNAMELGPSNRVR
jgi:hypothetical protein